MRTCPDSTSAAEDAPARHWRGGCGLLVVGLVTVTLGGAAPAQEGAPRGGPPRLSDLPRVDEGVEDQGPLSRSTRQFDIDLRQPTDFESLYQLPRQPGSPYSGWYARASGGLVAVYPRSVYQASGRPGRADPIPPGTVFLVGGLSRAMLDPRPVRAPANEVDLRVRPGDRRDARLPGAVDPGAIGAVPLERVVARSRGGREAEGAVSSVLTSPTTDPERVRALLRAAATAG